MSRESDALAAELNTRSMARDTAPGPYSIARMGSGWLVERDDSEGRQRALIDPVKFQTRDQALAEGKRRIEAGSPTATTRMASGLLREYGRDAQA